MIDLIRIRVKAGDGGKGCVAWRHEKFYANGGPFGGDGGKGGNVYIEVDTNETTLTKLRYTKSVKAGNGAPGLIKKMHGADGDDVIIKVPLGTMVRNAKNGDLMADLVKPHQIVLIAKGGKGGLGNAHFATARNDAPEYAQPGETGQSFELQLELRLLADAGLIGFPSVGKSTFLSVVTAARPQIAAYPFTTLEPNIGVVNLKDGRSFVLADMPGLIEGAAEGKGLGDEFLRHIRRCRVLIHVLDMSGEERDPLEDYVIINQELASYDGELAKRPQIIVANKMDAEGASENLKKFKAAHPDLKIYETSTMKHEGLDAVLYAAMDAISEARKEEAENTPKEEVVVYRYTPKRPDFEIINLGNRKWKVQSDKVDRLAETVDFNKEEDTYAFAATLQKMGIDKALRDAGAENGDQVIVGSYIMDFRD
ncbi:MULTISPECIES: GTPase ObgE [Erysipelotrichaceae]|jgi:GTP-binding protein|uniref:GTPase ObgE n=1 Tax=Erysipelotrichaceae TaxID=128827 RepID=UPI000CF8CC18|nr:MULTISPECIES: GTPase ObgE [Erysipelotrichaceae]MDY3234368.1 GTPase ObgE [Erysipelotrichaceae bacterium]MDY4681840.1 GTPase ObgE [Lachnospiraceae bacterium]MCI6746380.1 GTPase ObgE [Anaerolactibacter massiliensis]MDD5880554.1 GTPase ObgE [Stecheria intestinalis]MDD7680227.1 GTPase ObgE [Stecheria intestinalis]